MPEALSWTGKDIIRRVPAPAPVALAGVLRHPVTQPGGVELFPLVAGLAGAAVVLAVVALWPSRRRPDTPRQTAPTESWVGPLRPAVVAVRVLAVVFVVAAAVAGRTGSGFDLRNVAPAIIVGAVWPLLVLGAAAYGGLWRLLDPWDAVARALAPPAEPAVAVWPALVPALAWVCYLSAFPTPTSPRAIGAALFLYSIVTIAGCLALGRERWLSTGEPLGLLLSWTGKLPRRALPSWTPPGGAEALLGVLLGGLLFGPVRTSPLWGRLNAVDLAALYAVAAVVATAAVFAATYWALGRWAVRRGGAGSVAAALVPAVASVVLAVAMARNRLFTSVQLLPALVDDPFGLGWDLVGIEGYALNPDPLGHTGREVAQAAVLLAGHVAGAVVLSVRTALRRRAPAALALCLSVAASAVAVMSS